MKKSSKTLRTLSVSAALLLAPFLNARASDHGDSPTASQDQGADIADGFTFLDPNDNTKVVLEMTVHGFIVPGEAPNFATFDPHVRYLFHVQNNGGVGQTGEILVTFGKKTSSTSSQTATITLPGGKHFTAPTTPVSLAATATPFTVTKDASGVEFFGGEVDDPFFFDLVAFDRFVDSVKAGAPDASVFSRGRDSFAGYNVLAIALRIPASMLRGTSDILGTYVSTERGTQSPSADGGVTVTGPYKVIDRAGNPAVNVALIPYADKDEYNASIPVEDAAGKFVPDILASLKPFGTDTAHIDVLAGIAVAKGDYLHLDLTTHNSGKEGGTVGPGFPNGRRLGDDVIDTLLTVINNGSKLGDNVNHNDVALTDTFPFFAPAHQPKIAGVVDDGTRN